MVDLFNWKEEYSVGVPQIDAQHRKLVSLLNQLHRNVCEGSAVPVLDNTLSQFISCARRQFAEQERMEAARDAELETDYVEHLTEKVLTFQLDFQSGKTMITLKMLACLKEWLQRHIVLTANRYTRSGA